MNSQSAIGKPLSDATRRRIFGLCRELRLDDTNRHALQESVAGKRSLSDFTEAEGARLRDELRRELLAKRGLKKRGARSAQRGTRNKERRTRNEERGTRNGHRVAYMVSAGQWAALDAAKAQLDVEMDAAGIGDKAAWWGEIVRRKLGENRRPRTKVEASVLISVAWDAVRSLQKRCRMSDKPMTDENRSIERGT